MDKLVLASASPRRRELLEQIGVRFEILPVDLDESIFDGEPADAYVRRLAIAKAEAGFARSGGRAALGSDTSVVVDGQVLGKPCDFDDARQMLRRLSNRSHQVMTAVAVATVETSFSRLVTTEVEFRALSDAEIEQYWLSGEPLDKAGAYGIQGLGAVFVTRIDGSYTGVVGLPLAETAELLAQAGVAIWNLSRDKE